jgi:hypothetical protein
MKTTKHYHPDKISNDRKKIFNEKDIYLRTEINSILTRFHNEFKGFIS